MKTNWQTKRFLITGIPGMGKTTIGNYLQKEHSFIHVDMESGVNISLSDILDLEKDVVITWGFVPNDEQISTVHLLKDNGFKLLWLDGNKEAAEREFIKRDSKLGPAYLQAQKEALKLQLERIKASDVITRIQPKIINTFDSRHQFKKLQEIVEEIENA
jgi:shikimate kinase